MENRPLSPTGSDPEVASAAALIRPDVRVRRRLSATGIAAAMRAGTPVISPPPLLRIIRRIIAFGGEYDYGNLHYSQDSDPSLDYIPPYDLGNTNLQSRLATMQAETEATVRGDAPGDLPAEVAPEGGISGDHPAEVVREEADLAAVDPNTSVSEPDGEDEGEEEVADPATKKKDTVKIEHFDLPVEVTQDEMHHFHRYFSLPGAPVTFKIPEVGDIVNRPASPQFTSIFIESMSYGLRLPLNKFISKVLRRINRAPGQLRPLGWLSLTAFQVACAAVRLRESLPLFPSSPSSSQ